MRSDAEQKMYDDADNTLLAEEIKHKRFFKAYKPLVEQSLRDLGHAWEGKEYGSGGLGSLLDVGSKKRFWIRALPPHYHKDENGEAWMPGQMKVTLWIGGKPDGEVVSGDEWWSATIELNGIAETMRIEGQEIQCFTLAELEHILHEAWERVVAGRVAQS
jgi:hypothetical protein